MRQNSRSSRRSNDSAEDEPLQKESVAALMERDDDLNTSTIADKMIELNCLFNDVIRDALSSDVGGSHDNEEQLIDLDENGDQKKTAATSKVNTILIDQVVQAVINSTDLSSPRKASRGGRKKSKDPASNNSYPSKEIEQRFIELNRKLLTLDAKAPMMRALVTSLQKIYERLHKKKKNEDQTRKAKHLMTKIIEYLVDLYVTPKSASLSQRVALLLFLAVHESHLKASEMTRKLLGELQMCIVDMLAIGQSLTTANSASAQKKQTQIWGMQLALQLTSWKEECLFFKLLVQTLAASRFEAVRKKIIRYLKIDQNDKETIQACLLPSLIDEKAEVRMAAYLKLKELHFELGDVQGELACMTIIKEGMADSAVIVNNLGGESKTVRDAYIDFITPTLFRSTEVTLNEDERSELTQLLAAEQVKVELEQGAMPVLQFCPGQLFDLLDLRQAMTAEYFVQLPFIAIGSVFAVAQRVITERSKSTSEGPTMDRWLATLTEHGDNFDVFLGLYAAHVLEGLKMQATVPDDEEEQISKELKRRLRICQLLKLFPEPAGDLNQVVTLRLLFEFSKWTRQQRSQAMLCLMHDEIVPTMTAYQGIFDYIVQTCDRSVLAEWLKFSLQLNIEDETTRSHLTNLLFTFVAETKHTFTDYRHLLGNRKFILNGAQPVDYAIVVGDEHGEIEGDGEYLNIDDAFYLLSEGIRSFDDLGVKKLTNEYLKPFSFEMLVRDSDDACQVAVMITKRLLTSDNAMNMGAQFSREMLQIISDVREPLEQKMILPAHVKDDEDASDSPEEVNWVHLQEKYRQKLDEKLSELEEYAEDDSGDLLLPTLQKAVLFHRILEEINLKRKLTTKRALNLCLILLKQCRANITDKNLIEICQNLILPALRDPADRESQILGIEAIGLMSLLEHGLFLNYSKIFSALLEDCVDSFRESPYLSEGTLHEAIIALKSSIDGLIVHGVDEQTEELQDFILMNFLYSHNIQLRQIAIEGTCKLLFSIKVNDAGESASENANSVLIISHLIIHLFDKSFLQGQGGSRQSVINQALNMFFKHYILYSQQKCQVMLQALLRVVYSVIHANFESESVPKVLKVELPGREKHDNDDSDLDEYEPEEKVKVSQCTLETICASLDMTQICQTFLVLLSKGHINENAPSEFHLKRAIGVDFLLNLMNMTQTMFRSTLQIIKSVVVPLLDAVNLAETDELPLLRVLHSQMKQAQNKLVKGLPKLTRFVERLEARIQELSAAADLAVDDNVYEPTESDKEEAAKVLVARAELEDFFAEQIVDVTVILPPEPRSDIVTDEENQMNAIFASMLGLEKANQEFELNSPAGHMSLVDDMMSAASSNRSSISSSRRSSRINRSSGSGRSSAGPGGRLDGIKSAQDALKKVQMSRQKPAMELIPEIDQDESVMMPKRPSGMQSSSERPKKLVKFDLSMSREPDDELMEDEENSILVVEGQPAHSQSRSSQQVSQSRKAKMTKLSAKLAEDFLASKKKESAQKRAASASKRTQQAKDQASKKNVNVDLSRTFDQLESSDNEEEEKHDDVGASRSNNANNFMLGDLMDKSPAAEQKKESKKKAPSRGAREGGTRTSARLNNSKASRASVNSRRSASSVSDDSDDIFAKKVRPKRNTRRRAYQ